MLKEITIYNLGGQGGVTAARLIALAAMKEGYYSQAMPQFGPERRGAVVNAFVRISDKPIRRHSRIRNPSMVVIFDRKIRIEFQGEVVLNSPNGLKVGSKTWFVDATEIAIRNNLVDAGWAIINTAMTGAMARSLDLSFSSLEEAIKDELNSRVVKRNIRAAKEAYEVVRWI
jgi:pyruvate ferredoxin oxidoreductase gamma subunit